LRDLLFFDLDLLILVDVSSTGFYVIDFLFLLLTSANEFFRLLIGDTVALLAYFLSFPSCGGIVLNLLFFGLSCIMFTS
jgi:hypothetical protein